MTRRPPVSSVLVFFLTRARLAEPNVVLLVPLVLVLTVTGALPRWTFIAVCVIPLAFSVVNHSPLELLFTAFPGAMELSISWVERYKETALVLKAALVVAWQVAGWWIVVLCFGRAPAPASGRNEAVEAYGREGLGDTGRGAGAGDRRGGGRRAGLSDGAAAEGPAARRRR